MREIFNFLLINLNYLYYGFHLANLKGKKNKENSIVCLSLSKFEEEKKNKENIIVGLKKNI